MRKEKKRKEKKRKEKKRKEKKLQDKEGWTEKEKNEEIERKRNEEE